MQTLKSGQKVEVIKGLAKETVKYLEDLKEKDTKLKQATETIKLRKIDEFYNGMTLASKAACDMAEQLSDTLAKLATTWGQRPGMAPAAVEAFEEAKTMANSIKGGIFSAVPVELSNDLNEEYTEDTRQAFKSSLTDFCAAKDPYIASITPIIIDNMTADTQEVFSMVGAGVEHLCNAMVDVLELHKTSLSKFDLGLEEIVASTKATSNIMNEAGSNSAKALNIAEDCLN